MKDYTELAKDMAKALAAAKRNIPQDILGEPLSREDYRNLGVSLFIEKSKQELEEARSAKKNNYPPRQQTGGKPHGNGNYNGNITEDQITLIDKLEEERGQEGTAHIIQFLSTNGKKKLNELTKSEAKSLIDTLIPLPRAKR